MRPRVCLQGALAAAALVFAGCDSGLAPEDVAGLYRLESYNSLRVPCCGSPVGLGGVVGRIERGELLLLPDGTFESAIASDPPGFLSGTWTIDGSALALVPAGPSGATYVTALHGDSLTLAITSGAFGVTTTLVWRRFTRRPPQVESGRYVLTAVNGAGQPFIVSDYTDQNGRYVRRVDFDSLELRSGIFFTRHWQETSITYPASGDSLVGWQTKQTRGTFLSQRDTVTLMDYWLDSQAGAQLVPDHLKVTVTGLERRFTLLGPVVQTFLRY